jgi:hypothetical protein
MYLPAVSLGRMIFTTCRSTRAGARADRASPWSHRQDMGSREGPVGQVAWDASSLSNLGLHFSLGLSGPHFFWEGARSQGSFQALRPRGTVRYKALASTRQAQSGSSGLTCPRFIPK